ncbi:MAG: hypothetical protein ACRD97_10575 [Nitrososphaeraceae archaeon]|jgi:TM2 domain-containing membrane protein YozV
MSSINTDDTFLNMQEENLQKLTSEYTNLRETVDGRFTTEKHRLYPIRVGACIAVFVACFSISFGILPISGYANSLNAGMFSVIVGISAGIIMGIIFVVDDNLKTQRLNEKLAAKSYEIKRQRSNILSYLQYRTQQL